MRKAVRTMVCVLLFILCSGCANQKNAQESMQDSPISGAEELQTEDVDYGQEMIGEEESTCLLSVKGNPVDLKEAPTIDMLERSVINKGNLSRLAVAMEKSKSGEEVTIAFLGGSITQGSSASTNKQYANQVTDWWEKNLGPVNGVNAGVGATDSYIGVHRVNQDVLANEPDIIFIEFAVNDTNQVFHKYTYDSLLLKCLTAQNEPAVILLMMTQEDGTSLDEVHSKLGIYYDLPVLSYKNMIYPEVSVGNITWSEISPDNIHPNDVGHTILAKMITNYLDEVCSQLDSIEQEDTQISVENYTEYAYENAHLVNRASKEATSVLDEGDFSEVVSFQTFTDGWGTKHGGSITFEVDARNFGILYKKDTSGNYGKAEIYIDDELFGYLDANYPRGWGNYVEGYQIYSRKETEHHIIKITVPEGRSFDIVNLLIS